MSVRCVVLGVCGGLCCAVLLAVPMLLVMPALITSQLYVVEPILGVLCGVAALLTMIAVGSLGARWEQATSHRGGMQRGACIGMIIGGIVWGGVGSSSAGIIGNMPIWIHGPYPAINKDAVTRLIAMSIDSIVTWHYTLFWSCLFVAMLLGAIGGWMAGFQRSKLVQPLPRLFPLQVWKMVITSVIVLLIMTSIIMPSVYFLLAQRTQENLITAHVGDSINTQKVVIYPQICIYGVFALIERWALYLVFLDHRRTNRVGSGKIFQTISFISPWVMLCIAFIFHPQQERTLYAWLGYGGIVFSFLVGVIHIYWRSQPTAVSIVDPPMRWYDWLSGLGIAAVVCGSLSQLFVLGFPLSLVIGIIGFIGVLMGEEQGAVPTVASTIDQLISTHPIGFLMGACVPLILLPFFLLYVWVRGRSHASTGISAIQHSR